MPPAAPGSPARAARAASGPASAGRLGEAPGERADAHVRAGGEHRQIQRLVEALQRPRHHGRDRVVFGMRGHRRLDQLRLAAGAVGRDHQPSRDGVGDLAPVVATHDVQAEVDPRSAARRRQHASRVDVEHVGVDRDLGMAGGELGRVAPVRRRLHRRRAGPRRRRGRPRCRSRRCARPARAPPGWRRRPALTGRRATRARSRCRPTPAPRARARPGTEPARRGAQRAGRSAATVSSYHHGTSSSGRSSPKTSTTIPSSNGATPDAAKRAATDSDAQTSARS